MKNILIFALLIWTFNTYSQSTHSTKSRTGRAFAPRDEQAKTKNGATFTRIKQEELTPLKVDAVKFGEGWREPDINGKKGIIWGDMALNDKGEVLLLKQADAVVYCKKIGAELPKREDFIRLRELMGAKQGSHEGYTPQILPNLHYDLNKTTYDRFFWSSSIREDDTKGSYFFGGYHGAIGDDGSVPLPLRSENAVRCIFRS